MDLHHRLSFYFNDPPPIKAPLQNRRNMSVTISNCDQICQSPLNQSKAKMLYTFSRQPRFNNKIKLTSDKFYNLPHDTGRGASLGFGHKYDFTKSASKSPPPNTYHIASDFDKNVKKGTGFGEGREEMTMTGPFVGTLKNKNPGPGNYDLKSTLNKTSYSMFGRISIEDKEKLKIPGPGSYDQSFGLSPKGKYFLAKHKSSCVRNFNHSIKRGAIFHNIVPGPGKYQIKTQQMSPEGKYFVSKMHNSMVRRFGTALRQPIASNSNTPGPGMYRLPSQFGYYESKRSANLQKLSKGQEGKQNSHKNA